MLTKEGKYCTVNMLIFYFALYFAHLWKGHCGQVVLTVGMQYGTFDILKFSMITSLKGHKQKKNEQTYKENE